MVTKRRENLTATPREAGAGRPFTVDEYERLGTVGVLPPDERVELLEGEIVYMAPIGSPHATCVDRLLHWFWRHLPELVYVRGQGPIRLPPGSEPQPDIAIVRGHVDLYVDHHPGAADVLLLIEVSDTTLTYDRTRKLPLYAAAGIPEVWLADLARRRVLVYRAPLDGRYTDTTTVARGGTLSPAAFPALTLALTDVFGPKA